MTLKEKKQVAENMLISEELMLSNQWTDVTHEEIEFLFNRTDNFILDGVDTTIPSLITHFEELRDDEKYVKSFCDKYWDVEFEIILDDKSKDITDILFIESGESLIDFVKEHIREEQLNDKSVYRSGGELFHFEYDTTGITGISDSDGNILFMR